METSLEQPNPDSKLFLCKLYGSDICLLNEHFYHVALTAIDGHMSVFKGHAPLLTFLKDGLLFFYKAQKDDPIVYSIESGVAHIENNCMTLFTDGAQPNDDPLPTKISNTPYDWLV